MHFQVSFLDVLESDGLNFPQIGAKLFEVSQECELVFWKGKNNPQALVTCHQFYNRVWYENEITLDTSETDCRSLERKPFHCQRLTMCPCVTHYIVLAPTSLVYCRFQFNFNLAEVH